MNVSQAILTEKADTNFDNSFVDGKDLPKKLNHKVFLLNKPYGVISSFQDNHRRKSILSFLPSHLSCGIHPVGRLSCDS